MPLRQMSVWRVLEAVERSTALKPEQEKEEALSHERTSFLRHRQHPASVLTRPEFGMEELKRCPCYQFVFSLHPVTLLNESDASPVEDV